jgi:adenosine deaminase
VRALPGLFSVAILTLAGPAIGAPAAPVPSAKAREFAVAAVFEEAAKSPLTLRIFLRTMPKGGDLHNHLGGAIYAEDYIAWAREANFCRTADGLSVEPPPCPAENSLKRVKGQESSELARLVDAFSTRGYPEGVGHNDVSGNTQFFQTFSRFGPIAGLSNAKMLAAERRMAAADHLSYVELDHDTNTLGAYIFTGPDIALTEKDLPARFEEEMRSLGPLLDQASAELDRDEAAVRKELACDGVRPDPGCAVTIHYLFQGFRALPPSLVFRSLILAFAMADHDPRYVGINIVQPEDHVVALRDYDLHMAMIRFLAAKFPKVHRTLHAGELTFGEVPPADLRDHIAKAVAAGAERIGHGVDIAYEDDPRATMALMARKGIAVEINLTSNDVILGVKGDWHPLNLYRKMGVPVTLSTDDQGVLRTDMTNEYVRAAREQGLVYADLKAVARASLEYSFIPGASLWSERRIGDRAAPCAASLGAAACTQFLTTNEKARIEAEFERKIVVFEQAQLSRRTPSMVTK